MNARDTAYFASPALSKSRIDLLLECPALYKADIDGMGEQKESKALSFGSLAHLLTLEPERFSEEYAYTELNLTTKEGKAWKASLAPNVEVIKQEDYEKAVLMADAVRSHPQAKFLFGADNYQAEQDIYWEQDGIACKAKPDIIAELNGHRFLGDLKTTESVNPNEIQRSIAKWGYYRQAAWYLNGMEAIGKPCEAFIFLFVEKSSPYLVTMCQLDSEALAKGMSECVKAIDTLKHCRETGIYPCYTRDILTLSLPQWAYKESA